jgi:hypothetical protein
MKGRESWVMGRESCNSLDSEQSPMTQDLRPKT